MQARGVEYRLELRARRIDARISSAATPTGAGPIWFPINYLILESLKRYHKYFGDDFKVECPTGSGTMMKLHEVFRELARRLSRIFLPDEPAERPVFGGIEIFQNDPHWKDLVLFHEYFHGDTGAGPGRLAPDRLDRPDRQTPRREIRTAPSVHRQRAVGIRFEAGARSG